MAYFTPYNPGKQTSLDAGIHPGPARHPDLRHARQRDTIPLHEYRIVYTLRWEFFRAFAAKAIAGAANGQEEEVR